jgi:glycosyltransferase involved in cell wall biosynthesis
VEVGAYALISRLLRRRFVYVVASSVDVSRPHGQVVGPLRWLFPTGLRLADAVVCRTLEQQAWLRNRYGRDGVLIRTAHPIPPEHSALGAHHSRSTILWVGRMHPLKQPELFLDLAERLPQERCSMVVMRDPAHAELGARIRDRIARLPNVTLHENVPWTEVGRWFDRAKLLVNTSTYEGFPNTFVQAAMHGTPILSFTVDPDGVLARHRIGIDAGGSFDRLATAAERVCRSKDLRAELGRRARAYGATFHDLSRSAEELKALLRMLCTTTRRVRRHG